MSVRTKKRSHGGRRSHYSFAAPACILAALGAGTVLTATAQESAHLDRSLGRVGETKKAQQLQQLLGGLSTEDLTGPLTPADLVETILGPGVTVSNVTFGGAEIAAGTFSGGGGLIGIESGIMLSSGDIANAIGPNMSDEITTDNGLPGDSDLDGLIPGFETLDATILEFDFECICAESFQFRYVWSSDEYNEFVGSEFNDVFGFFLNGQNIALIPSSGGTAVAINNVNCDCPFDPPNGSFCNLYNNNDCNDIGEACCGGCGGGAIDNSDFPCSGAINIEMDGFTQVFTAVGMVQPGINHIKLAIADAGDRILDSNIFIEANSFLCNLVPVCDAGGPYSEECAGLTTEVQLDGSGSFDPDDCPEELTFSWSSDCPGVSFDDPSSESPVITVDTSGVCPDGITCNVFLTVDDGEDTSECSTTVTIEDTTQPEITCPDDVTVTCGDPTDPSATGMATATDVCDPDPLIDFDDDEVTAPCPADPVMFTINRTWMATDDCGNTTDCEQDITVLKVPAEMDIKPGSCPNAHVPGSNGFLPISLLGTADFDVTDVDLTTVRLSRGDCVGGTVAPNEGPPGPNSVISDEGTPFDGPLCECHELHGDGIPDLSLKFSRRQVDGILGLSMLPPGSEVELVVTGELADGCVFVARDCVRLVPRRSTILAVESNLPRVRVDVEPADLWNQRRGIAGFDRVFPQASLITLTAPATVSSHPGWVFVGWEIDGMPIPLAGRTIVIVTLRRDQQAVAVYENRSARREVSE